MLFIGSVTSYEGIPSQTDTPASNAFIGVKNQNWLISSVMAVTKVKMIEDKKILPPFFGGDGIS